jgi:hypothetical protein
LRGIATRTAVDAIQLTAIAAALAAIPAPTATVVAVIVIQGKCSLISDLAQKTRSTDPLPKRITFWTSQKVLRAPRCRGRGRALTAVSSEFRSSAQRFAPFADHLA